MLAASATGIFLISCAFVVYGDPSLELALAEIRWALPLGMLIQTIASVGVLWVTVVKFGKRRMIELEGRGAAGGLLYGLGAGILFIGIVVAGLIASGHATLQAGRLNYKVLYAAVFAAGSATAEEVAMRGILLRLLVGRFGVWPGLLVSSCFFGLMHATNPNATLIGIVAVASQAGLIFGIVYLTTGRLWAPIGMHAGWNFAQVGLFGLNTSGVYLGEGMFKVNLAGPDWITGGQAGVEGSVFAAALGLIAIVGMWLHHRDAILQLWRSPAARSNEAFLSTAVQQPQKM